MRVMLIIVLQVLGKCITVVLSSKKPYLDCLRDTGLCFKYLY